MEEIALNTYAAQQGIEMGIVGRKMCSIYVYKIKNFTRNYHKSLKFDIEGEL